LDIRSLRHVLAVIETGSLNKAAAQLGISQPALSKAIQRLESELGVPLFERRAKGVRPTLYGNRWGEFARSTCAALDRSVAELTDLKNGSSGTVAIYGPPLIASHIFPEIFSTVQERCPGILLRFVEQVDNLIEVLLNGDADLVVGTIRPDLEEYGLRWLPLFEEDLVLICRRGHPVTRLKSITPRALAQYQWVFSTKSNLHRRRLERYFEDADVPLPRPIVETSSPGLIRAIVARSDSIALMARMGAVADRPREIDCVALKSPLMMRSVGIMWRADYGLSVAAKNVVEIIVSLRELSSERK